jgi:hypothetical protein
VALAIQGLGKLLEAGQIPSEMLMGRVRGLTLYTTTLLALVFILIAWCGIAGIAGARSVCWEVPASAVHPLDKGGPAVPRSLINTQSLQRAYPPRTLASTLHPHGICKHASDRDFSSPKDGV